MDTSTLISMAALIVAILTLPSSYFIAIRQVKVGLNEFERRSKQNARIVIADRLDEFYKVFYSAVRQFTGIELNELNSRLDEIDQHIKEIDKFVEHSGILNRLAVAIDDLAANRYSDLQKSLGIVTKLQDIRSRIALGSDANRSVTAGIFFVCVGANLQSVLRGK